MQIEGTHGVDPLGIREGAKNLARADQAGPGAGKAAAGPVSESEGFEPYVRGTAEAPEVRAEAVSEAKRLLASGGLDTPEGAARAAERLLRDGI